MSSYLVENEALIRGGGFVSVLLLMMLIEWLVPRRAYSTGRARRWPANLGLVACNALLIRAIPYLAATGMAVTAAQQQRGLFNLIDMPAWFEMLVSIVILDFVIYWQHRTFHAVPLLWRLHRVHHTDVELDVTSGARFHPLEILLSMVIKLLVVFAIGAPVEAVILFELILNTSAMFNHSNIRLPAGIDTPLRILIVTPDMHRIHHSVKRIESDSNYGFFLSVWDRLFSSWTQEPAAGQLGMQLGQTGFRNEGMIALLFQPARNRED